MENASKALLIAGAVLICILLIGIGVAIYNASKAPSEHAKVTSEAISDESKKGATEVALNLKFAMGKRYTGAELGDMKNEWDGSHEQLEQLSYVVDNLQITPDNNIIYKVKSYDIRPDGIMIVIEPVAPTTT